MELLLESDNLNDYLQESPPTIDFHSPLVKGIIQRISNQTQDPMGRAKLAFEYARDNIQHSFDDSHCKVVTIQAEDVIKQQEGICFAKAHVLASLLRGMGIPTGFCYQLKKDAKAGFALHGLNAIYLEKIGWFRVDPRGNKPGINSQFSIDKEELAYSIDENLGEKDYPTVFVHPLPTVLNAMESAQDVEDLFYKRPTGIF